MIEINHRVSKEASNLFWRLGNALFHDLHLARGQRKRVPQFPHLRNKLYDTKVPKVNLKIGYQSKEDGEITVFEGTRDPVSRFPPHTYKRIYEIAWVDVSIYFQITI